MSASPASTCLMSAMSFVWRRKLVELAAQVIHQRRLAQDARGLLAEILEHHVADHLRAANPAAEAQQRDQFLVVQGFHRLLDLVLGGFEFLAQARSSRCRRRTAVMLLPRARISLLMPRVLARREDVAADVLDLLASCASTAM